MKIQHSQQRNAVRQGLQIGILAVACFTAVMLAVRPDVGQYHEVAIVSAWFGLAANSVVWLTREGVCRAADRRRYRGWYRNVKAQQLFPGKVGVGDD